jgi:hypothetical protein
MARTGKEEEDQWAIPERSGLAGGQCSEVSEMHLSETATGAMSARRFFPQKWNLRFLH